MKAGPHERQNTTQNEGTNRYERTANRKNMAETDKKPQMISSPASFIALTFLSMEPHKKPPTTSGTGLLHIDASKLSHVVCRHDCKHMSSNRRTGTQEWSLPLRCYEQQAFRLHTYGMATSLPKLLSAC